MNLLLCWGLALTAAATGAEPLHLADLVDPMFGVQGLGSCMPGPCLPHSSVYPSPDTLKGATSGYNWKEDTVGFSQLHTQGTGGTPTYGNFLISPQIGLQTAEADHASPRSDEKAACYYYRSRLDRYGILCEVVPTRHAALYKFTFPASRESYIAIDIARKLGKTAALDVGGAAIDAKTGAIRGGGTFSGNWNPAPYQLYFQAKLSKPPAAVGVWKGQTVTTNTAAVSVAKEPAGLFARYATQAGETVYLKIAVSFRSEAQGGAWLNQEIPSWDFEALREKARGEWDRALATTAVKGVGANQSRLLYSHLFHALVQPRDRTGDHANWESAAPFWDDHYTLWDSWKTLFPLLTIIRPDVVRDNVNSFIDRHEHNGYVATAFIQGKEYKVGQGGDEVDNVIADAYVKGIPGVDWEKAYAVLRHHAEQHRTAHYRNKGFVAIKERDGYCVRMKSGSGTLAFAYNDFAAAQLAKGLGKQDDCRRYLARSQNWKNVWDPTAEDSGYQGFIRARGADGRFAPTPPRKGYNADFYEGTCWVYSYVVPHAVPELIELMGGRRKFIDRLSFALESDLIDFTNEPSFMTIWLFHQAGRPDLASRWANVLRGKFTERGYPGDEDDGAMSSLAVFLAVGLFPIAGQDIYYLHGPSVSEITFHPPGGKPFTIRGKDVSPENIYVQSVELNGKPLATPCIRHCDIVQGGTLVFQMRK